MLQEIENKEQLLEDIEQIVHKIPDVYLNHFYRLIEAFYESILLHPLYESSEVSLSQLKSYVFQFRKTFSLLMKQGLGIQAAYHFTAQQEVCIRLTFPELADYREELVAIDLDLPAILVENDYTEVSFQEELNKGKVVLFWQDSFVIVKGIQAKLWTSEQAKDDARELLGFAIQQLPLRA